MRQKLFTSPVRGKNALAKVYLDKALHWVDAELDLLDLRITYPEAFAASEAPEVSAAPADPDSSVVNPPDGSSRPALTLIPKFQHLGIMGMAELLTALSLLGGIENEIGQPPSTIALAKTFEQAFGFSFKNIYDRQGELFTRKAYNITKTLDALKGVLVKEFRRRGK